MPSSRVVSQAETRRQLKERARTMLLELGFAEASVGAIASSAGFTTGAFYSNFGSKAELTVEILDDLQAEAGTALKAILDGAGDARAKLAAVRTWSDEVLSSGWPRLELEFALANRTSASIVRTEGRRNRFAVDEVAEFLTSVAPEGLPVSPRRAAEVVLDLSFGLAVRRIIDPDVGSDHIFELIESVMALAD